MNRRSRGVGSVLLVVFAAVGGVGVFGFSAAGCSSASDTVVPNPSCAQDLTILSGDAAIASAEAGSSDAATTATTASDGSIIFAPCALSDGSTGATPITATPVDDSAPPTTPSCPSYTCVCDDETTETASMADPGSGSCESESQVCATICTSHGGWM
jgi:hypothetical protein